LAKPTAHYQFLEGSGQKGRYCHNPRFHFPLTNNNVPSSQVMSRSTRSSPASSGHSRSNLRLIRPADTYRIPPGPSDHSSSHEISARSSVFSFRFYRLYLMPLHVTFYSVISCTLVVHFVLSCCFIRMYVLSPPDFFCTGISPARINL
jgi:hypothetical protein